MRKIPSLLAAPAHLLTIRNRILWIVKRFALQCVNGVLG